MIQIQVIDCNGFPPLPPLSADFDELGGNIGRADGNALVLPDPERHISRTHAKITFRDGRYSICSLGSATPVYLNDQPLNKGETAAIAIGDNIRIGDYTMRVEGEKASGDAFDAMSRPATSVKDDPLAFFSESSDSRVSANLEHSPQQGFPQHAEFPSTPPIPDSLSTNESDPLSLGLAPATSEVIPSDFDPFAEPSFPAPQLSQSEPKLLDKLGSGPGPSISEKGIDNLLDPGNKLVAASVRANIDTVDPLVALDKASGKKTPTGPVQRDDVPEIHGSYRPPKMAQEPVEKPREANHHRAAADHSVSVVNQEALLRAFLEGAGVPGLDMPTKLSPQLMHLIGQLLRASTKGTLDLLLARSSARSEMRTDMTMIAPQENNPLKFSPDVEAALAHLLAPKGRGFMSPLQAMKDAHDDLLSHQFGFMAGVQAALAGVLKRFSPQELEQRLAQKSVFDTLFPRKRSAKLWALFNAHYQDISGEAKEDFDVLFGKEFLRAYEAQIAKLKQEKKPLL